MSAVTFQRKHRVHHMLHELGSGNLAVLGHMAHDDERRTGLLDRIDQLRGNRANLPHASGNAVSLGRRQRLHGVHNDQRGRFATGEGCNGIVAGSGCLGEQVVVQDLEPFTTQLELRQGFFTGNIDDALPCRGNGSGKLQKQRAFPDTGFTAKQDCGTSDQPLAQHSVQIRGASGMARAVFSLHLAQNFRTRAASGRGGTQRSRAFASQGLDLGSGFKRVPFAATGASPLPVQGAMSAA